MRTSSEYASSRPKSEQGGRISLQHVVFLGQVLTPDLDKLSVACLVCGGKAVSSSPLYGDETLEGESSMLSGVREDYRFQQGCCDSLLLLSEPIFSSSKP